MRYKVKLLKKGEVLYEDTVTAQTPSEAIKIVARNAGLLQGYRGVLAKRIPPGNMWYWQPSKAGAVGTVLGKTYQARVSEFE